MTLALDLSGIQWSPQQRAVFAEVERGDGHVIVEALAGTGKTTTAIEALNRLPRGAKALLCAFNKSIAEELEARAPRGVKVQTLHGLGAGILYRAWGKSPLDPRRPYRHLSIAVGEWRSGREGAPMLAPSVERELAAVLSLCKSRLVDGVEQIEHELLRATIALPEGVTLQDAAWIVARALDLAIEQDGTTHYDDMVYVPARLGLRGAQYDVVFVDETQDMSRAQLVLAQLALKPGGRLVLIGDRHQAIYGWRGADVGSMERMTTELDATVLPLSITRRCPRSVVALAQQIVPAFEAAPEAPEGAVKTCPLSHVEWTEGDLVVSRLNAPLARCALAAIRQGKRARIQGREFAQVFRAWAQSFGARRVSDLLQVARAWVQTELTKLGADEQDVAEDLLDRVATLEALAEGCSTVEQLFMRLDSLFSDEGPGLLFSSTHRAKGMERDRVFVLAWTFKPDSSEEGANLWYVAITRAKHELTLVTGPRAISDRIVLEALEAAR